MRRFFSSHLDSSVLKAGNKLLGTTVLNVRKGAKVAMIADGQVSMGPTVFKNNAVKIRRILPNILCGFAGNLKYKKKCLIYYFRRYG